MSSLDLSAIDADLPLAEQASKYMRSLRYDIALNEICLVGMLSADVLDLPDAIRSQLRAFFEMQEKWLDTLLQRAESERGQPYPVPTLAFAKVLYGAMQNGMIVARMTGSTDRLDATTRLLLGAVAGQRGNSEPSAVTTH